MGAHRYRREVNFLFIYNQPTVKGQLFHLIKGRNPEAAVTPSLPGLGVFQFLFIRTRSENRL
jgi:hypothetical protein